MTTTDFIVVSQTVDTMNLSISPGNNTFVVVEPEINQVVTLNIGPRGPAGANGAAGPQGIPGQAGPYRAAWSNSTNYVVGDIVTWIGNSYICTGNNHGGQPDQHPELWDLFTSKGADGANGAPGAPGAGVAIGGSAGQLLVKLSGTDYDTAWIDNPVPTGDANTFAGFGATNLLETVPRWSFSPDPLRDYGLQFSNTIDLAPDAISDNYFAVHSLYTNIIPTASTVFQHAQIFSPSVNIDPNNSGFNINSVHLIDAYNVFQGSGVLSDYSHLNLYFDVSNAGTVTNTALASLGYQFRAGATAGNTTALTLSQNHEAGSFITQSVSGLSINGNIAAPMTAGGYGGINLFPQFSSTLLYLNAMSTGIQLQTGSAVAGGVNIYQDQSGIAAGATAQNYTSYAAFPNIQGAVANGISIVSLSPSFSSTTSYTSMINAGSNYQSGYLNSGAIQAFTDSGSMHSGSRADNYTSFNANPNLDGTLDNYYYGLNINPNGSTAPVQSLTGVGVNFGSFMTAPYVVKGLSINQGVIQQGYELNTQYITPEFVYGINNIGGVLHVAPGFPINSGQFGFGNNIGVSMLIEDDIGLDGSGANLGFSSVGFVGQIEVSAGKTMQTLNMLAAGAGISGGSGSVIDAHMFRALGFLPEGGTLNITNLFGFKADSLLAAVGAVNLWSFFDGAGGENYLSKLSIGTLTQKVSNSSVALEIGNSRGMVLGQLTTVDKNSLSALPGMMVYDTDLNQVSYYNGTSWVNI